jgi:hypothetical protein
LRIWRYISLSLAAIISFSFLALLPAETLAADERAYLVEEGQPNSSRIHLANSMVRKPKTDGSWVVWAQSNPPFLWDVYGMNLQDGEPFPIAAGGGVSRADPVIDGGTVVWSESTTECPICERDILAMDLESGERFTIASGNADQTRPAVSGDYVVWVENSGDEHWLLAAPLGNTENPVVLSTQHSREHHPKIDGVRVVWVEQEGLYSERQFRLMTARIGDNQPEILEDFDGAFSGYRHASTPHREPDNHFGIDGDTIAYVNAPDLSLVIRHLNGTTPDPPPVGPVGVRDLAIEGRWIVGFTAGQSRPGYRLQIWDIETLSAYIPPSDVAEAFPDVSDGYVVWQRGAGEFNELHGRMLPDLLPTAPQPPPEGVGETSGYAPETGHYLRWGFHNFWMRSGGTLIGTSIFGFPITEEFDEFNNDTGRLHTVQYFERQRFEYHPELAGTPYEVQLGRLGFQEAEQRGLFDTDELELVSYEDSDELECQHHEPTDQPVCGKFLEYWQSYGLDFGDSGTSFRESLALFGYAVTPAFIDPDTGLATQYFERARFEHHPDNPEDHRVLLGRLGSYLLDARDW